MMRNEDVSAMPTFVSEATSNFVQRMGNDRKERQPAATLDHSSRCPPVFSPFGPFSLLAQKPIYDKLLSLSLNCLLDPSSWK